MKKNKVYTIICMIIVALTTTLATYAQEPDINKGEQMELILYNHQKSVVTFFVTPWNKKGGGDLIREEINPADSKKLLLPSDTNKIQVFTFVF